MMGYGLSKIVEQLQRSSLPQLPAAHMGPRNRKMWRINRQAQKGGLKHATPGEPSGLTVP